MAFFTIITPFFNTQKYIERCLDSISMQSFRDIEIILINDGSTDKSTEIARAYASKDKRIKLIEQENKGQGHARNVALREANGDYIIFVDSDDYIDLDMCERLYEVLKLKNIEVLIKPFFMTSKTYKDRINKYLLALLPKEELFNSQVGMKILLKTHKNALFITTIAHFVFQTHYLREKQIYFPENMLYEDVLFCTDAFLQASNIKTCEICGYHYYHGPNSTMRGKKTLEFNLSSIENYYKLLCALKQRADCTLDKTSKKILDLSVFTALNYILSFLAKTGYHHKLPFSKKDLLVYADGFPAWVKICIRYPKIYGLCVVPAYHMYKFCIAVFWKMMVVLSKIKRFLIKILKL